MGKLSMYFSHVGVFSPDVGVFPPDVGVFFPCWCIFTMLYYIISYSSICNNICVTKFQFARFEITQYIYIYILIMITWLNRSLSIYTQDHMAKLGISPIHGLSGTTADLFTDTLICMHSHGHLSSKGYICACIYIGHCTILQMTYQSDA